MPGWTKANASGSRWRLISVILVVTVAGYLPLLGWHQLQEYQTWKVWTLVGVLAVLAACYGWRDTEDAFDGALAQGLILTGLWSVDAATQFPDGMWLAGAMFVFAGAFGGALLVANLAALARQQLTDRRRGTVER